MEQKVSTTRCYSDSKLSMESTEDIAIKQIQKEDEKEQTLINQIQQEHIEMSNEKIVSVMSSRQSTHGHI